MIDENHDEPVFVPMQQLWKGRGGWGGIITATDGTVVAFQSPGGGNCRRSRDGGKTWDPDLEIAPDAKSGRALVDETKGEILYANPGAGWLLRSRDRGASWTREKVEVRPDGFGLSPQDGGVTAMQSGITLAFGKRSGRLIMPARIMGPKNSNAVPWRPYHYSSPLQQSGHRCGRNARSSWRVDQQGPRKNHRLGQLRRWTHLAGQTVGL
jgi:hypothetical protein